MTPAVPGIHLQCVRWTFRFFVADAVLSCVSVVLMAAHGRIFLALTWLGLGVTFAALAQSSRARLWRAYWDARPDGTHRQMRAWLNGQSHTN